MPRGRPRKTDPGEVLEKAMHVFWTRGYEATSMNDVSAATGMAKPGLYATFGDKEALYTKALTFYFKEKALPLLDDLKRSPEPLKVVLERDLKNIATALTGMTASVGCFVVNTLVECAGHPTPVHALARQFEQERRTVFLERIQFAIHKGEISEDADPEALADFFAGQTVLLAVMARAGSNEATLHRFIDTAMKVLEN